jgi:hypothetical protein
MAVADHGLGQPRSFRATVSSWLRGTMARRDAVHF